MVVFLAPLAIAGYSMYRQRQKDDEERRLAAATSGTTTTTSCEQTTSTPTTTNGDNHEYCHDTSVPEGAHDAADRSISCDDGDAGDAIIIVPDESDTLSADASLIIPCDAILIVHDESDTLSTDAPPVIDIDTVRTPAASIHWIASEEQTSTCSSNESPASGCESTVPSHGCRSQSCLGRELQTDTAPQDDNKVVMVDDDTVVCILRHDEFRTNCKDQSVSVGMAHNDDTSSPPTAVPSTALLARFHAVCANVRNEVQARRPKAPLGQDSGTTTSLSSSSSSSSSSSTSWTASIAIRSRYRRQSQSTAKC